MQVMQSMQSIHVRSCWQARWRGWAVGAILSAATSLPLVLGGCCTEQRREMDALLDKYYEQAFMCCKERAALDPTGGAECFQKLAEWRLATATKILEWYQACLDGEQDIAGGIVGSLKALLTQIGNETCGTTLELPNGRNVTAGIPFVHGDTIEFEGAFDGMFKLMEPPDAPVRLDLEAGAFRMEAFGSVVTGRLNGSLELVAHGPNSGTLIVERADLEFGVGSGALVMTLDDHTGGSYVRFDGMHGVLQLRVAISTSGDLALFTPSAAWLRIPVQVSGSSITFAGGIHQLIDIIPPAPGWADWNGDWVVDEADWAAFFAGPDAGEVDYRDLNLDGSIDATDIGMFADSWREAMRH
ncbi:MAG: hypothetical protein SGJ11_09155 [Phycisphaerae bacterium]|nr:hypothetical protein [Phycisphaerae bacterium]